jgi:hypothetical protein
VLLVLALTCLGAAPAVAQRDQEMIHALSTAQLKDLMTTMDLDPRAPRSNGGNDGFLFQNHTLVSAIYIQDEGRTLQLIGMLEGVKPGDERINAFNAEKRFARAYVAEGDLFLQQEIDLQKGVTRANVRAQIELFRLLASNFVEAFQ